MGFLARIFGLDKETWPPPPHDDYWFKEIGPQTTAGARVNADTAMRVSAVYGCVRVLAETLASLPLLVYERMDNGGKKRVQNHPLYELLHDQPNEWQTSFEWREMMMGHLALRGNAYSEIVPGRRGFVDQLIPRHPDRVRLIREAAGKFHYEVLLDDGTWVKKWPGDILHLRGLSSDGYMGLSPIGVAREAIGLSMVAEEFGCRFFSNGVRPSGVLHTEGTLKKDVQERLRKNWQETYGGAGNAHRVAVLEAGLKWQQMGMSNEDSQFLELRNFQVEDIARIFRVPVVLLQHADKSSTYASAEQFFLSFVVHTMRPWLVRWEQRLGQDLILAPGKYFVEFLIDGLLRGDSSARAAFYNAGVNGGWLTRNEVRQMENKNPIDGLDTPLEPQNMGKVGGKETAK